MSENIHPELTIKEYYTILVDTCNQLEIDPDDDIAIAQFTDAAYHLAKANCAYLFPDGLMATDNLSTGAYKTPEEGVKITSVLEDDNHVIQ